MKKAVFLHLYYLDLWDEISSYIANIPGDVDVYINFVDSVSRSHMLEIEERSKEKFKNVTILVSENRGRDIGGYVSIINYVISNKINYDLICFIHSKKHKVNMNSNVGISWRRELLNAILGSKKNVQIILSSFKRDPNIGMVGADKRIQRSIDSGHNLRHMNYFFEKFRIKDRSLKYVAGTIFWCRGFPILDIFSKYPVQLSEFENDDCRDGRRYHAMERVFGNIIREYGYKISGVKPLFRLVPKISFL